MPVHVAVAKVLFALQHGLPFRGRSGAPMVRAARGGRMRHERRPGRDESATGPDLRKLAQDWITLWQSELAGLAADREAQETLAGDAGAVGRRGRRHAAGRCRATRLGHTSRYPPHAQPSPSRGEGASRERADRRAGAAAPPGTAPAAAAPDPRDAEIDRLARHDRRTGSTAGRARTGVRRGERRPSPRRCGTRGPADNAAEAFPGGGPGGDAAPGRRPDERHRRLSPPSLRRDTGRSRRDLAGGRAPAAGLRRRWRPRLPCCSCPAW